MNTKRDRSSRSGCLPALAVLTLSIWVGTCGGIFADSTLPTLAVLIFEPVLWLILLVIAVDRALARRWLLSGAAALGWLWCVIALRAPSYPTLPEAAPVPPKLRTVLKRCAKATSAPSKPVQIVTWNVSGFDDPVRTATALDQLGADIAILQEVPGQGMVDRLVEIRGGTGLFAEAMLGRGTAIVLSEGTFHRCASLQKGDTQPAKWVLDLPSAEQRRAIAVLTFVSLPDRGLIPILGVHLDRPGSLTEIPQWPTLLHNSAHRISGVGAAIKNPTLVVAGDTNTHGTFRSFLSPFGGSKLTVVPAKPTWPASVKGIPALPLYHLDRLWHGSAWQVEEARTVRVDAPSDHLALVVRLAPSGT